MLDGECSGNPALRAEVESLLAAHAQAGTFFNQPDPTVLVNVFVEKPGDKIGRNCVRKLAKAVAALCMWPNRRSRSAAAWR